MMWLGGGMCSSSLELNQRCRCICLECATGKCLFNDRPSVSFFFIIWNHVAAGALNSEVKARPLQIRISSSLLQVMQLRVRKQVYLASSSGCSSFHDWCGEMRNPGCISLKCSHQIRSVDKGCVTVNKITTVIFFSPSVANWHHDYLLQNNG